MMHACDMYIVGRSCIFGVLSMRASHIDIATALSDLTSVIHALFLKVLVLMRI